MSFSCFVFYSQLPTPNSQLAEAAEEPVTVRAEQVEYFDTADKVEAKGNVVATYREMKLTCDQATIYMQTKDAYLRGRVRLVQPGGLLRAHEAIYNFQTRKGTVLQAEGEVDPWRSKGERAHKVASSAFLHREGYITSCDFEKPHTRFQAKQVHVFLDDKVVLKNVVMYVGNVPALFLPSYTHPLDDKRPRVTIVPGKDKQWGLFTLTAWRLYLHENLQGRIHVDYREKLDLASGVDLKYELPVGGEGIFRSYYTNERALQREHLWSRYFSAKKNRQLTKERERFRTQLRHRWKIDEKTQATLEYHRVKDATFNKDFFLRESEKDSSPSSYFQFANSSNWYGLTFLMNKRINRFETVTQQWPSLTFNLRPFSIPWLPTLPLGKAAQEIPGIEKSSQTQGIQGWQVQSSYNFTHSNVADSVEGTKDSLLAFDTKQELFYPMRLIRRFNLRPFFTFRQLSQSRGKIERAPQFQQAAAVGFDLGTKIFRTFLTETDFLGLDIHHLRHIITPSVAYEYQAKPTISSDRLLRGGGPAKANAMTFGMEHKFQTKRKERKLQTKAGEVGQPASGDLVRFNTSIPYDLEGPSGRGGRWGNVGLDFETKPYGWLSFESDGNIDTRIGKITSINADLVASPLPTALTGFTSADAGIGRVVDPKTGKLKELPWAVGVGWRYQRNTSGQLVLETEFDLGLKWRMGIYQGFDVKRFITETSDRGSRTVKKVYDIPEFEYRLRRDLHEWTVELIFNTQRQQGESLLVLFRLKAFPEMPFEFARHYHQPKAGKNFPKSGEVRDRPETLP